MKLKKFLEGSGLRTILWILAAITIGSIITFSIADGIKNNQRFQKDQLKRTGFGKVLQGLEFKGLDEPTKDQISNYAKQFDESMNLIITDDSGKVLFRLNDGYLAEPELFTVVVNPRDSRPNQAYIIDSKGSLRYQVRLDQGYNSFKLVEKSANNNLIQTLFPEETDQVEAKRNKLRDGFSLESPMEKSIILIADRFFGGDYSNIMNYAYIGSKSWHVYSIYKDTYDYTAPNTLDWLVDNFHYLALTSFLLFWFLLPLWVFHDARKRDFKAALWGIVALVTNVVGLIIYLVVRPELAVCKQCGAQLNSKFVTCPNCGAQNRERCVACKQIIEKNWVACPYCGQFKTGMEVNSTPDM